MFRLAFFVWLTLLCVGCHTVRFSEDSRRAIHVVHIDNEIEVEASYSGRWSKVDPPTRSASWYIHWITAPVGVSLDLIDWSANKKNRAHSLKAHMRDAEVDVGDIVRQAMGRAIDKSETIGRAVHSDGDAKLQLEVEYGFDDGFGIRGGWKPWLVVSASIVDRQGQVHWRREESFDANDARLPAYHQPFLDPEKLRAGFRKAARIVTKELIQHMNEV